MEQSCGALKCPPVAFALGPCLLMIAVYLSTMKTGLTAQVATLLSVPRNSPIAASCSM